MSAFVFEKQKTLFWAGRKGEVKPSIFIRSGRGSPSDGFPPGTCRANAATLLKLGWATGTPRLVGEEGGAELQRLAVCVSRIDESLEDTVVRANTSICVPLLPGMPRLGDTVPMCATMVVQVAQVCSAATVHRLLNWFTGAVVCDGCFVSDGPVRPCEVLRTTPSKTWVQVVPQTRLLVEVRSNLKVEEEASPLAELLRIVAGPFDPATRTEFERMGGLVAPRGVLLVGPPGTGKTRAVNALKSLLASFVNLSYLSVAPAEASASVLWRTFAQAGDHARKGGVSLVFLDEMDAITEDADDDAQSLSTTLASLMDAAPERVVVVACSNRPDALDLALRRFGRFEVEIRFSLPTPRERGALMENMMRALGAKACTPEQLRFATDACVGFSPADLAAVARHLVAGGSLSNLPVIVPASLRQATRLDRGGDASSSPSMVVGQDEAKHALEQAIIWPLTRANELVRMGLGASNGVRGVLLYGPPGCAKTSLVRAVLLQVRAGLFSLSAADVYSCGVGEAEAKVRRVFADARLAQPSVVFLDEVDALVGSRKGGASDKVQSRVLSTLLNEMDGCEACEAVVVVGATNRPWNVDDALLRAGRFDRKVRVVPPDPKQVFSAALKRMGCDESLVDDLARQAFDMSGADMMGVCRHAAVLCVERGADAPEKGDFDEAFKVATRSVGKKVLELYEKYNV